MPIQTDSKKRKKWLIISLVALFLIGGLYYFFKDEPLPDPNETKKPSTGPGMIFSGGSLVEEKDGIKMWELDAESIETIENNKKVRFLNAKGVFYKRNETDDKVSLIAEEAVVDLETSNIQAKGNVKISTDDGIELLAPVADWDNANGKFVGSGGIKLIKEDTVITGDTIESSLDSDKVVVKGNARVTKGGQ